jgi:hypothetical protein
MIMGLLSSYTSDFCLGSICGFEKSAETAPDPVADVGPNCSIGVPVLEPLGSPFEAIYGLKIPVLSNMVAKIITEYRIRFIFEDGLAKADAFRGVAMFIVGRGSVNYRFPERTCLKKEEGAFLQICEPRQ